jgi:hypothetical protein
LCVESAPTVKFTSPEHIEAAATVPAIQPVRLRQQAALLAGHFDDPPAYLRSLHHLLDYYSDRARRPGQSGKPAPLISTYNVRPPVLRMLLQEVAPLAEQNQAAGLELCEALWAEPCLEFRLLAAMLLGQIPPNPPELITEPLQRWITIDLEFYLIEELLSSGIERLRRHQPQALIRLAQTWLGSSNPLHQQVGLRALIPLIQDPEYENLPVFFKMIQPLTRSAPAVLRPDLLDVLAALARRSPQETAYFLRHLLNSPDAPDAAWLLRQSLQEFPPEVQESLRKAGRDVETASKRII